MNQSTKNAVEKFPVRSLLLDTVLPWTIGVSENVSLGLSRFFALITNAARTNRIHSLSVFLLGKQIECVFPLQSLKSNIAKLMRVLQELKLESGFELNDGVHQDALKAAFEQVISQFRRSFVANKQKQSSSASQLEVCIVTCQTRKNIERCFAKILKDVDINFLKKVQVINIKPDLGLSSPPSNANDSQLRDHEVEFKDETINEYFEFIELSNDSVELEYTFKSWIVDSGVDDVQMIIEINSQQDDGIILKCDIQERLINPSMVPDTQQQLFESGHQSECTHCSAAMKNANAGTKVCHFKAARLIGHDGICESVPVILRPTSCWKLDWEELDVNQQKFQSIRTFLLQQEMCLLLESREKAANNPKTFCLLLPSAACGMLLKCVANFDVILPLSNSLCIQKQSESVQMQVDAVLVQLPRSPSLNPLTLKSGIAEKLLQASQICETKKTSRATKRQVYDGNRVPKTIELARVGRSEQSNNYSQKRSRFSYKPSLNNGSFVECMSRDFPEDDRPNDKFF